MPSIMKKLIMPPSFLFEDKTDDETDLSSVNHDDDLDNSMGSLSLDELCCEHYRHGSKNILADSFHDSFCLGKELGSGKFGIVYECNSKLHPFSNSDSQTKEDKFAVKKVYEEDFDEQEVELLKSLQGCSGIVGIEGVYFEQNQSYIVMEQCHGGDVLTKINEKGCFGEDEACIISLQLISTMIFCHKRGIAHRDIKLENLLLKYKGDDTSIQLADFGLATRFFNVTTGNFYRLKTFCGTLQYTAPEVLCRRSAKEHYDERCDNWSIGVVIYILLAGYQPFQNDDGDELEIIKAIRHGDYRFHRKYWETISADAKDLIASLLVVDPNERLELCEALDSPWFDD